MSLTTDQKKQVVSEVTEAMASAQASVLAEYRGLSVASLTALRNEAREQGVFVRVVKNTLVKRAISGTQFECLSDHLSGPLILTSSADPVAVAKVTSNFAKDNDAFKVTIGAMNGEIMDATMISNLSKLPSRDELLSTLLGTMQAPVQKFVRTLNEVPTGFVRGLQAVADSKAAA